MAKRDRININDIAEQSILELGRKLSQSLEPAEKKINIINALLDVQINNLKKLLIELAKVNKAYKGLGEQKTFLNNLKKEKELLESLIREKKKFVENIKIKQKHEQDEIRLLREKQKLEQEKLRTEKLIIDVANKRIKQQKQVKKLTEQEKVDQAELNRRKKEDAKLTSNIVGAYQKLNIERNKAQKSLANLLARGQKAGQSQRAYNKELRNAQREFDRLDKKVKAIDSTTRNYSKNIGNYASAFKGLGGVMRNLFSAFGLAGGLYTFVNVMRDSVATVREFGATMSNISGILGTTRENLEPLEEKIIAVAGASVNTATQVGKLAESLVTMGIDAPDEIANLLEPVNNLSIGLEAAGDESAEFLVQMLNTFGGSTAEAGKYADQLASIRTSSTLTFTKMRDSFQYLAPISKALDKGMAYTGSLIGILADNGIKAERAGRLLASGQAKLASEGKTLNDALKELNDAKKNGATQNEILALSSKLLGTNANALGLVLANNTDKIEKNADAIRNNKGALDGLVNEQLKSLDAKFKILGSRWEEFILNTDKSSGASESLGKVLDFLSENLETIISTVVKLGGAFVAYKAVMFAVQKVTILYSGATKIASAVSKAFAITQIALTQGLKRARVAMRLFNVTAKASTIGLIVAGVTALTLAYRAFKKGVSDAVKAQLKMTKTVENFANKARLEEMAVDDLFKKLKSLEKGSDEYKNVKKQIIDQYGGYLKGLDDEVKSLNNIEKAYDAIIGKIKQKYREEAKEEAMKDSGTNFVNIEQKNLKRIRAKLKNEVEAGRLSKDLSEEMFKEIKKNTEKDNDSKLEFSQKIGNAFYKNKRFGDVQKNIRDIQRASREFKRQKKELDVLLDSSFGTDEKVSNNINNADNLNNSDRQKQIEEAKKLREEALKDEFELAKYQREQKIKEQELIKNDEKKSYVERINALRKFNELKKELVDFSAKYELKQKGSKSKKRLIRGKATNDKKDIDTSTNQEAGILYFANLKEELDKREKLEEKLNSDIEKLRDKFRSGQIKSESQFQFQMNFLKIEHQKEILNSQIDYLQQELTNQELSAEQRLKVEEELNKKRKALNDVNFKQDFDNQKNENEVNSEVDEENKKFDEENLKKQQDKLQKIKDDLVNQSSENIAEALNIDSSNVQVFFDALINGFDEGMTKAEQFGAIASASIGVFKDLGNNGFEERIAGIDEEIGKLDEIYEKKMENMQKEKDEEGNILYDKKKLKEDLDKDKEKKKEELEKKKKKELHKQAKFNRDASAFNIGIKTAEAIMSAWAIGPAGIPIAVTAGIVGAIQLAAVLSKPLPKYKLGRKGGKKELAILGDGGKHEVISNEKSGRLEITPNKDTIYKLQEGDVVHSSIDKYMRTIKVPSVKEHKDLFKRHSYSNMVKKTKYIQDTTFKQNDIMAIFDKYQVKLKEEIKQGFKNVNIHNHNNNNFQVNENYNR